MIKFHKSPKVAIVKTSFEDNHSSGWNPVWIKFCKDYNIEYEVIDWRSINAFERLSKHDIVLWHYSHYSSDEMLFAANILSALKMTGCRVFPDLPDSQHFDDKVAQSYFIKALGLGSPENFSLHSTTAVEEWIKTENKFPVVAKLRTGSGSQNVQLIESAKELRKYSKTMFRSGIKSIPSFSLKLKSNVLSVKSLGDFFSRMRRVPEFIFSRNQAKLLPLEKGYVYLQEFIPDVDYDLKIAIVGNKLSFVARGTRPGEFRASGSGSLFYDKSLMNPAIIKAAFTAYDALNSDCTGLDMIMDPRTNKPVILEISYGFSHTAQINANGHFDRAGNWVEEPLNPPYELLKNLISEVSVKKDY